MAEPAPQLSVENDVALDWQPQPSTLVENWYYRRSCGLVELGNLDEIDVSDLDSIRV